MKRDMELMKMLLLNIEEKHDGFLYLDSNYINIPYYSQKQLFYHAQLLYEGGLITYFQSVRGDSSFNVGGLTNDGHGFLELIRNPEIWDKTQEEIEKKKLPETIEWISRIAGIFTGNVIKELNN